jgi:DNA-binding Lrp family transcriptional regulator
MEIKMIKAYILISMKSGKLNNAISLMKKIVNIEKISIVAGQFDMVIRVNTKELEDLLELTNKIQMIKEVEKTITQIIEKEIVL